MIPLGMPFQSKAELIILINSEDSTKTYQTKKIKWNESHMDNHITLVLFFHKTDSRISVKVEVGKGKGKVALLIEKIER